MPPRPQGPCLCSLGAKCDRKAPFSLGTGFSKDKSIELYRDAKLFVEKNLGDEDQEERVFLAKIALKPCFVLASNKLVKEFLGSPDHYYNGLKDFFFGLFGHSLLFAVGEEARTMRRSLMPLFDEVSVATYQQSIDALTSHWSKGLLSESDPVAMYTSFKNLALSINLKVFLGIDVREQPEMFEEISQMTTKHWHGIISVPFNVKLSFFMSSSYRKAQDNKEKLLKLIETKLSEGKVDFLARFQETGLDVELIKNHMLVFVCALIPKAAASVLASFVDSSHLWYDKYVDEEGNMDDTKVEHILLEVLRLWPPFIGSLRVAEQDTQLGSYHIPKGHSVFPVTMMAHRDPEAFPYPEKFLPERWETFNAGDRDKMFGFGAGVHSCVGERFMWAFLKTAARTFVKDCVWDHKRNEGKERKMKYLPVARPAELQPLKLTKRT